VVVNIIIAYTIVSVVVAHVVNAKITMMLI